MSTSLGGRAIKGKVLKAEGCQTRDPVNPESSFLTNPPTWHKLLLCARAVECAVAISEEGDKKTRSGMRVT